MTAANSSSNVSISCIDFIWRDQDLHFNQCEDKDESEPFGDTKGTDICNSIALREVVTIISNLSELSVDSLTLE